MLDDALDVSAVFILAWGVTAFIGKIRDADYNQIGILIVAILILGFSTFLRFKKRFKKIKKIKYLTMDELLKEAHKKEIK